MTKRDKMIKELNKMKIERIFPFVCHIIYYHLTLRQIIRAVNNLIKDYKENDNQSYLSLLKLKSRLIKIYFE